METKKEILNDIHIPRWNELPNIDLYLDQVVTFIEDSLSKYIVTDSNEKKEETSKIITKTMINNYVKQGVLEPPVKKKYNRLHIASLFCICILKQVYSINDTNNLIKLALKTAPANTSYNVFCLEIENAIKSTFNKKPFRNSEGISEEKYILRNVAQTFASKFYVQKVYLKK